MSSVNLRGYDVDFPYPVPYDIQKTYMDKVLQSLEQKTHAVLESPTGTGKTLCLFAPMVAWAKRKKQQNSAQELHKDVQSSYFESKESQGGSQWGSKTKTKVWYTARTHSQIAQAITEVRKCNIEGLNVRVMGARDQLCINELVLEEQDSYIKTVKCKELVKAKKCKYYMKYSYEKDIHRFFPSGDVHDIEDLVSVGKSCGMCPYFLAKRGCDTGDVILLPYNYIIDRESREANGVYLENDVVIFDEGHNVPSTCEESYEFSFNSLDIALGIKNIQEVMHTLTQLTDELFEGEEIDIAKHASNSMSIMEILQKLESALADINPSNELLPVSFLYELFDRAGINGQTSRKLMEGVSEFKSDSEKLAFSNSTLATFNLLEKILNITFGPTIRSFERSVVNKSFKCNVVYDPDRPNVKKFSLFCFNPSFGIKNLTQLGVQSIIITSGTLSPLKTFIYELGLSSPVTLENNHIAKKCQVPFIILGTGVNNVRMDGAYKNRNDPKYISSLGMSLTNLIGSIPDGVLLLFSSYGMMQKLKESWESELGIWTRLNALKRVFVEPRNKDEFINCMENYKRAIDSGNGAVLMGVLRGKISEGMDFKDQYCRGVFIIGVPFPPIQDPRVIGKQNYSESLMVCNPSTKTEEKLYNQSFLAVEAMKATNQAIGRAIRHGKDYGAIILVDYRFTWPRLYQNISSWLRGDVPVDSNFPSAKKQVTAFFRDVHYGNLGVEEVRCQRVDSNGCPVASYVTYDEYDHKKQPKQPKPWIGLSERSSQSSRSESQEKSQQGHADIVYEDEADKDFVPSKLLSIYKMSKASKKNVGGTGKAQEPGSLLDALENSRSSSVGYRETEGRKSISSSDSNKRKFEEDDEDDSSPNDSYLKQSPSLFSSPEQSRSSQPKKFAHLKVKPLLPATGDDCQPDSGSSRNPEELRKAKEEELKNKLIDYYRMVKQCLSKEEDMRFKTVSCKYMKSEASLAEVIEVMDDLFLKEEKRTNLFGGFKICIKSKDSSEWAKACSRRKIFGR